MSVTTSIAGQFGLLNRHVEELNDWLEAADVDERFPTLHVLGTPTEGVVADAVDAHASKLARFERRVRRETDVDAAALTDRTRPIRFDCRRIASLFTSAA